MLIFLVPNAQMSRRATACMIQTTGIGVFGDIQPDPNHAVLAGKRDETVQRLLLLTIDAATHGQTARQFVAP